MANENSENEWIIVPNTKKESICKVNYDDEYSVWLIMEACTLESWGGNQKGSQGNNIVLSPPRTTFKFLLPMDVPLSSSHNYGEYESYLKGAATTLQSGMRIGEALINSLPGLGAGIKAMGNIKTSNIYELMSSASNVLGTAAYGEAGVNQMKFDTTLTWQNSARRQFNFTFNFADLGNTFDDVYYPIKKLECYSCAEVTETIMHTQPPSVFRIRTHPIPFIQSDFAVLSNMNPVYKGPYRNGIPMRATLQLTFQELVPYYRSLAEREIYASKTSYKVPDSLPTNNNPDNSTVVKDGVRTYGQGYQLPSEGTYIPEGTTPKTTTPLVKKATTGDAQGNNYNNTNPSSSYIDEPTVFDSSNGTTKPVKFTSGTVKLVY